MAETYRRGGKKYLGIDFAAEDYEALRQIAKEDGNRGVSSLVRSIVRAWLRSRETANQPAVLTMPATRHFSATEPSPVRPLAFAPPSGYPAFQEMPEGPAPPKTTANEADEKKE